MLGTTFPIYILSTRKLHWPRALVVISNRIKKFITSLLRSIVSLMITLFLLNSV